MLSHRILWTYDSPKPKLIWVPVFKITHKFRKATTKGLISTLFKKRHLFQKPACLTDVITQASTQEYIPGLLFFIKPGHAIDTIKPDFFARIVLIVTYLCIFSSNLCSKINMLLVDSISCHKYHLS